MQTEHDNTAAAVGASREQAGVEGGRDVGKRRTLADLAERIEAVERRDRGRALRGRGPIAAPWMSPVALQRGAVHEWVGVGVAGGAARGIDLPPLCLLADMAHRAADQPAPGVVVWVGRRCWPHPRTLIRDGVDGRGTDGGLLARSLFFAAKSAGDRLWAADPALRSPAVALVVMDAAELDMAATRRLQLAAEAAAGMALLARPVGERDRLSAAATRWWVEHHPSPTDMPRWKVTLLRCRHDQVMDEGADDAHAAREISGNDFTEIREVCDGSTKFAGEVASSNGEHVEASHHQAAKDWQAASEVDADAAQVRKEPKRLTVILEWNSENGAVTLPADVADRSPATTKAARRRRIA